MSCHFNLKRKFMLFFCILFSSIPLSYGGKIITQTSGTASSWLAQGLASLMLIGIGARALAIPYCTPDANNRIDIGPLNMTRCLEQNRQADFFFVENIDFSQLPQAEQNKFPLYSASHPFSGHLTMPPFSLNNFNITRNENAAFFGSLANSIINANFSNAEVRTNSHLYDVALLTNFLQDYNDITLEIDSAKIYGGGQVGGVASSLGIHSESVIVFEIKGRGTIEIPQLPANVENIQDVGMAVGFIDLQSKYDITVLGNEIFMMCRSAYSCGGVVGQLTGIDPSYPDGGGTQYNSVLDLKVNLVNIIGINTKNIGAFWGFGPIISNGMFKIIRDAEIKKDARIDHLIVNGEEYTDIFDSMFSEPRASEKL